MESKPNWQVEHYQRICFIGHDNHTTHWTDQCPYMWVWLMACPHAENDNIKRWLEKILAKKRNGKITPSKYHADDHTSQLYY